MIALTAAAGGVAATDPHQLSFVAANWATDPAIGPIFTPGATHVRLLTKKTGGSGTVTIQPIWMGG